VQWLDHTRRESLFLQTHARKKKGKKLRLSRSNNFRIPHLKKILFFQRVVAHCRKRSKRDGPSSSYHLNETKVALHVPFLLPMYIGWSRSTYDPKIRVWRPIILPPSRFHRLTIIWHGCMNIRRLAWSNNNDKIIFFA